MLEFDLMLKVFFIILIELFILDTNLNFTYKVIDN